LTSSIGFKGSICFKLWTVRSVELSRSATQSRAAPGSRPRPAPQPADASSPRPAMRDDERAVDVVDCTNTHVTQKSLVVACTGSARIPPHPGPRRPRGAGVPRAGACARRRRRGRACASLHAALPAAGRWGRTRRSAAALGTYTCAPCRAAGGRARTPAPLTLPAPRTRNKPAMGTLSPIPARSHRPQTTFA
jgi:hypothetical protein